MRSVLRAGAIVAMTTALLGGAAVHAAPAPTTGLLEVRAEIQSGCRVVGQALTSGVDFGRLDFGTHPSLFNTPLIAQAQLASGALRLRCVGVTSAQLTIDAGLNALGNQRRMASSGAYVPYELFADAAATELLGANTPRSVAISPSGALTTVDLTVFGRVLPATGGYAPGIYQDQVQVTVSW